MERNCSAILMLIVIAKFRRKLFDFLFQPGRISRMQWGRGSDGKTAWKMLQKQMNNWPTNQLMTNQQTSGVYSVNKHKECLKSFKKCYCFILLRFWKESMKIWIFQEKFGGFESYKQLNKVFLLEKNLHGYPLTPN